MLVDPRAQDREEVVVADLLAQGLQRHPAAEVHGGAEELVRSRVARRGVEVGDARRSARAVSAAEALPGALEPQPLGVGGEALVEPDVLPRRGADRVAHPLVRQLVQQDLVGVRALDAMSEPMIVRVWVSSANPRASSTASTP